MWDHGLDFQGNNGLIIHRRTLSGFKAQSNNKPSASPVCLHNSVESCTRRTDHLQLDHDELDHLPATTVVITYLPLSEVVQEDLNKNTVCSTNRCVCRIQYHKRDPTHQETCARLMQIKWAPPGNMSYTKAVRRSYKIGNRSAL